MRARPTRPAARATGRVASTRASASLPAWGSSSASCRPVCIVSIRAEGGPRRRRGPGARPERPHVLAGLQEALHRQHRAGDPGIPAPGGKGDMYVFDVGADNKSTNGKLFTNFMIDGVKCGPDGVRCDVDGNLWCSSNAGRNVGYSGVTVWTPAGSSSAASGCPRFAATSASADPSATVCSWRRASRSTPSTSRRRARHRDRTSSLLGRDERHEGSTATSSSAKPVRRLYSSDSRPSSARVM